MISFTLGLWSLAIQKTVGDNGFCYIGLLFASWCWIKRLPFKGQLPVQTDYQMKTMKTNKYICFIVTIGLHATYTAAQCKVCYNTHYLYMYNCTHIRMTRFQFWKQLINYDGFQLCILFSIWEILCDVRYWWCYNYIRHIKL